MFRGIVDTKQSGYKVEVKGNVKALLSFLAELWAKAAIARSEIEHNTDKGIDDKRAANP